MELSSKISEWNDSMMEFLNGQEWFQQLRGKWDELDRQTKTAVKLGALAIAALFFLFIVLSWVWRVHALRSELLEKRDLLSYVQTANNDMNQLKDVAAAVSRGPGGGDQDASWQSFFNSIADSTGIEKGNLSVVSEKIGTTSEQAKETFFELVLKKTNVKQMTQFAFALENGARPVKIRNMTVDSKNDPSGYQEVSFSISAFTILPPK